VPTDPGLEQRRHDSSALAAEIERTPIRKAHGGLKGLSWLILVGIAGVLGFWLLVPQRLITCGQQIRIVAARLQRDYTGAAFAWRIKYALRYEVNLDDVTFERKPFDCDWDASPIGSKHCHYERIDVAMNSKG
jgi:hypothetical protein